MKLAFLNIGSFRVKILGMYFLFASRECLVEGGSLKAFTVRY